MEIASTAPDRYIQAPLWGKIGWILWRIHESMKMSDPLMNELMLWIYSNNLQALPENSKDEYFRVKQSRDAHSEWVFTAQDFHSNKPYYHPALLEDVYSSQSVQYWDNEYDLSFYQYVWTYEWQKIRVIFYNSDIDYWAGKKNFQDWASQWEYSSIRICLG